MSIRLNKAIRELNIGLGTAVEFLEKRPELGEVKSDPSCKISDEQYNALSAAFAKDKEVRTQAEKLFQKKPKEKEHKEPKDKKESKGAETPKAEKKETRQEFKPLGKIDLDALNGKKKSEPKAEKKAEPAKEAPKAEEKKPEPVKVEAPKAEPVKEAPKKAEAPKAEEKKAEPVKVETPKVEAVVENEEKEVEVFTTKNERKMLGQKMNVVGKIDLDALNQSTRPKKKSKEERRKEREEKAMQNRGGQQGANGEKKKRNRINKERVDINAAANQPQGNGKNKNGKNGGNGNNQNNQNQQGGKKNKNKKQNNKPQEVNEEDVARQVKETLARLTSKSSQNKKGAKYRKEKRDAAAERRDEELLEQELGEKTLKLTEFVTVSELATMMDVPVTKLIGTLMSIGVMVSINQRLDAETINIVAEEFGFTTEYVSAEVQEAV
ncbi:MAG: translation initiation factor IF-2 N-terminal domain-containing protein, partial [Prevotellaceae bacterium]|nr:translation initiation factor IF-2 N-terminal domain-containing protein [Prevotellaceae bacterium]